VPRKWRILKLPTAALRLEGEEVMATAETPTAATAQPASYPQEIEVTLKLKIRVNNAEERAYYLNDAGEAAPFVIADAGDFLGGEIGIGEIITINDLTGPHVQMLLNTAAGL
jgi:hypothetical protein